MKAIIVKHENRIRTLEALSKANDEKVEKKEVEPTVLTSTATDESSNLAPDEV